MLISFEQVSNIQYKTQYIIIHNCGLAAQTVYIYKELRCTLFVNTCVSVAWVLMYQSAQ